MLGKAHRCLAEGLLIAGGGSTGRVDDGGKLFFDCRFTVMERSDILLRGERNQLFGEFEHGFTGSLFGIGFRLQPFFQRSDSGD